MYTVIKVTMKVIIQELLYLINCKILIIVSVGVI